MPQLIVRQIEEQVVKKLKQQTGGRLVRRLHHEVGTVTSLNVTPWIQFGQENEIHITRSSPGKGVIKRVSLDFHEEPR